MQQLACSGANDVSSKSKQKQKVNRALSFSDHLISFIIGKGFEGFNRSRNQLQLTSVA